MERNKIQEETPDEITEGTLEEVSGGTGFMNGSNCFFEPANPVKYEIRGRGLCALCKSICQGIIEISCSCRGTNRCVDRWHIIEQLSLSTYIASPPKEFNHGEQRKWVNGVKLE